MFLFNKKAHIENKSIVFIIVTLTAGILIYILFRPPLSWFPGVIVEETTIKEWEILSARIETRKSWRFFLHRVYNGYIN